MPRPEIYTNIACKETGGQRDTVSDLEPPLPIPLLSLLFGGDLPGVWRDGLRELIRRKIIG